MAKRGKGYRRASEQIDREKLFDPTEALTLVKSISHVKFDETVDVAVN